MHREREFHRGGTDEDGNFRRARSNQRRANRRVIRRRAQHAARQADGNAAECMDAPPQGPRRCGRTCHDHTRAGERAVAFDQSRHVHGCMLTQACACAMHWPHCAAMSDAIAEFERHLLADIPLARAMDLRVSDFDGDRLAIAAPLAPNINDKGCAFGGSLVSLLTLAGWGVIVLKLRALGKECEVYVQDSAVRYFAPVWEDFTAQARLDR